MDLEQLEAIALSADRTPALAQLIPGTEDYYFHRCLDHQLAGRRAEATAELEAWSARHGQTWRWEQMHARQVLLGWTAETDAAVSYLVDRLDIHLEHQRASEVAAERYPTRLDAAVVSREALVQRSLAQYSELGGFQDGAFDWLTIEMVEAALGRALSTGEMRQWLQRLRTPDLPGLVELVLREISEPRAGDFGSMRAHHLLTLGQLEALARKREQLLQSATFVDAVLRRLQPSHDLDWREDDDELAAYLERLWDFVEPLAPSFNSLRAHVLYHRLALDRRRGRYDQARFLRYLAVPRQTGYTRREYLDQSKHRGVAAHLGQDFSASTGLAPIGDDEPLVRDHLIQFFAAIADFDGKKNPFAPFVREDYLRRLFATVKIWAGVGDQERWYSLFDSPSEYQVFKDSVEIEWAPHNPRRFAIDAPVVLEVDVKNVPTMVVKVFEINTLGYYLAHGREVDTSVDLDGLVASEETTLRFDEPPQRRVRRTVQFPALQRPGVFVIELIGNGKSSRALVRKGELRFLERVGAAGHVFTVLDDAGQRVPEATLWLGGVEYRPRADGTIAVPFSTRPGRQTILLRHGELTTVDVFDHRAETYQLAAGIYVDREQLLPRATAQVVVHAALMLAGEPAPLSLLERPRLEIASTDRWGTSSSKEVPLELAAERDAVVDVQVPADLASLALTVRASVPSVTEQRDVELAHSVSFALNAIDATAHTEDLLLERTAAGAVLHLLGRTGEPRPHRPVHVYLQGKHVRFEVEVTLESDARGRIELGHLEHIASLRAVTPAGVEERWTLGGDWARPASYVHGRTNDEIVIPYAGRATATSDAAQRREAFALFELRGGATNADRSDAIFVSGGMLVLRGLGGGDYDLWLKEQELTVRVRVTSGDALITGGTEWIAGSTRLLEARDRNPFHLTELATTDEGDLLIHVANASPATRVHVLATRYAPAHHILSAMSETLRNPSAITVARGRSHYVSGRDIGDEYRYVLERRLAGKRLGNLQARPGLLLNPWAIRTTSTEVQVAVAGGAFAASAPRPMRQGAAAGPSGGASAVDTSAFSNLDFLAAPSTLLLDLRPLAGTVRVARSALAGASFVRVIAVDHGLAIERHAFLPEVDVDHKDLRLDDALPAEEHFVEKRDISPLAPSEVLRIDDVTTAELEPLDSLRKVYALFLTLRDDATLREFGFVLDWHGLDAAARRVKYSKYACHELNLFLYFKDRPFFDAVIRPYLRNKKDKTFLDRWLLEHDLSAFLAPWAYGRLNAVERALLGLRLRGEGGRARRHLADRTDLIPRDPEGDGRLFDTILRGSALEGGDAFGVAEVRKVQAGKKKAARRRDGERAEKAESYDELAMAEEDDGLSRNMNGGGAGGGMARGRAMAADAPAPPPPPAPAAMPMELAATLAMSAGEGYLAKSESAKLDVSEREAQRQLFRAADKTQEWAENNYYRRRIADQIASLVPINAFWRDVAAHEGGGPFLSRHIARAAGNFAEMMCALAVLDLPVDAGKHDVTFDGAAMTLVAAAPALIAHKQIRPAAAPDGHVPILVSQNYFRADDRYEYDGDEHRDKYVTGEMLVHVVYLCQVVLTNPTSSSQKLQLLLQIPRGSIPVQSTRATRGVHVDLASYNTHTIEYAFYFPRPGRFAHFPVHVARGEDLIAAAAPAALTVVLEPTNVDTTSWAWVSQHGTTEQVIAYLDTHNVERLDLEQIAWRMRDRAAYDALIGALEGRHVYHSTLWAYGLLHRDLPRINQRLRHDDGLIGMLGQALHAPPLAFDAIEHAAYEHLEYAPLINARAHRLGERLRILNDAFAQQYTRYLERTCYLPGAADAELLAATYYYLLTDRVEEATAAFARVRPDAVPSRLQYDHAAAYLALSRGDAATAHAIAAPWADHPVDRWRALFQAILATVAEAAGAATRVTDDKDRDQAQARLAATQATFDVTVDQQGVHLTWRNLTSVRINYYLMDVELLFSRQPFVQQQGERFSIVRPNRSDDVTLPDGAALTVRLPDEFRGKNAVIEVVANGQRRTQAHFANHLAVQVIEPYAQVQVNHKDTNAPLPGVYVKTYARLHDGTVAFYKDGYTDLRGRFDYGSISTDELDRTARFALLVLSSEHGAVIREAAPPAR